LFKQLEIMIGLRKEQLLLNNDRIGDSILPQEREKEIYYLTANKK